MSIFFFKTAQIVTIQLILAFLLIVLALPLLIRAHCYLIAFLDH